MKFIVSMMLLATPVMGFSADDVKKEQRFQERKAKKLERRAAKDQMRATTTACISAATTKEQMKACRAQNKSAREALRSKYKHK